MIMMVIMIIILMNIITMMRSKIRHKLSQTDSTTLKMFTNFLFSSGSECSSPKADYSLPPRVPQVSN